jgi:regulator of protease activity HflC (stomatin/prohibitin superfamily)
VEYLVALLIIVVVIAILLRPILRIVTVHDHERGLRWRRGHLVGIVSSGVHVALGAFEELQVIDVRPTTVTVPGQEILTADGVALKVSLTARYVVADPIAAVTNDQSWSTALYAALHAALRDAIAGRTADDILAARGTLGPAISGAVASDLARVGVELLAADVRDVMVPGDLKRAFSGIVAARREGEAALERARGETAALRSLANAGRMLDDNPGLLQLRILQQLGASSGNTLMLGLAADGRPAPPPPGPPAAAFPSPRRDAPAGPTHPVAGTDPGAPRGRRPRSQGDD